MNKRNQEIVNKNFTIIYKIITSDQNILKKNLPSDKEDA
jgi:hypothetical protein